MTALQDQKYLMRNLRNWKMYINLRRIIKIALRFSSDRIGFSIFNKLYLIYILNLLTNLRVRNLFHKIISKRDIYVL